MNYHLAEPGACEGHLDIDGDHAGSMLLELGVVYSLLGRPGLPL
jgi:hypothetical protein